jgi:hypothetical protein
MGTKGTGVRCRVPGRSAAVIVLVRNTRQALRRGPHYRGDEVTGMGDRGLHAALGPASSRASLQRCSRRRRNVA